MKIQLAILVSAALIGALLLQAPAEAKSIGNRSIAGGVIDTVQGLVDTVNNTIGNIVSIVNGIFVELAEAGASIANQIAEQIVSGAVNATILTVEGGNATVQQLLSCVNVQNVTDDVTRTVENITSVCIANAAADLTAALNQTAQLQSQIDAAFREVESELNECPSTLVIGTVCAAIKIPSVLKIFFSTANDILTTATTLATSVAGTSVDVLLGQAQECIQNGVSAIRGSAQQTIVDAINSAASSADCAVTNAA